MKLSHSLLALSLTLPFSLRAEDTRKASAGKEDAASDAKGSPADASWKEIEGLLRGPKDRPKSREEAETIFKKHFEELDAKSAEFEKAYPTDARVWKLKLNKLQSNNIRQALKLSPLSDDDTKKIVTDILASKDADKETKGMASYMQVMESQEKEEEFRKLAEEHMKAYPDFRGNAGIKSQLKTFDTEKSLKDKPLELAFTATDGTEVDISKMRGKVILVDFWATWCGPCVQEIPNVVATYKKLHEKGFEIVGISFDQDKDKLAKMTKDKEMPWVQYFDGEGWKNKFGQQFGINSIPRMWLVNKKGMVVDTNGRADLEKKVEKLLAE